MNAKQIAGRAAASVPGRVANKFLADGAANWAVLIAWNALFAFFPILLLFIAVLGLILGGKETSSVVSQIVNALPQQTQHGVDTHRQVLDVLKGAHHASGIFFVIGIVGLVWGGSALFGAMDQVFAVLYATKPREFVPQKLMSVGMILVFTALGGIAVLTSTVLPGLRHLTLLPAFIQSTTSLLIQVNIGVVAGFILFLTIYFVVPNRRQRFRNVWPGSLVAGLLFELVTLIFPSYLSLTNTVNQYGQTFGLFFILLTFFFFFGIITMVGAEVNSVLHPIPADQALTPTGAGTAGVALPSSAAAVPGSAPELRPSNGRSQQRNVDAASNGRPGPVPVALLLSAVIGFLVGRRSNTPD